MEFMGACSKILSSSSLNSTSVNSAYKCVASDAGKGLGRCPVLHLQPLQAGKGKPAVRLP